MKFGIKECDKQYIGNNKSKKYSINNNNVNVSIRKDEEIMFSEGMIIL